MDELKLIAQENGPGLRGAELTQSAVALGLLFAAGLGIVAFVLLSRRRRR